MQTGAKWIAGVEGLFILASTAIMTVQLMIGKRCVQISGVCVENSVVLVRPCLNLIPPTWSASNVKGFEALVFTGLAYSFVSWACVVYGLVFRQPLFLLFFIVWEV